MNFFTHFVAGFTLFISSLFGGHVAVATVATTTVPTTATSQTSSVSATTTAIVQASSAAQKKPSFLSSIESIGSSVVNSSEKVIQATKLAVVASSTTSSTVAPTQTTIAPTQSTTPVPTPSAPVDESSIDQKTVNAVIPNLLQSTSTNFYIYSSFTLTGRSSTASSVYVVIVPNDYSPTDWATVGSSGTAVILSTPVSNGGWSVVEKGIADGNYKVMVFNDTSTHELLTSGSLNVQGTTDLSFVGRPGIPITLGLGETATDGDITIKLKSVSGSGSSAVASLSITSTNGSVGGTFSATEGKQFPTATTGYNDPISYTGALNIKVSSISTSAKTVVIYTSFVQESPSATGMPVVEGQ